MTYGHELRLAAHELHSVYELTYGHELRLAAHELPDGMNCTYRCMKCPAGIALMRVAQIMAQPIHAA